jgi:transposase
MNQKSTPTGPAPKRRIRRTLDEAFKTKVVLEALKETLTLNELASKYQIHPNQISQWKSLFLKNAINVFSGPKEELRELEYLKKEREELHKRIGEKDMDIEFLKKNLKKLNLL